MKIITLIENLVNNSNLVAEHGLSLYIETGNKKMLFDTGQSGLFLQNAKTIGISIEDVDILVLSHGHHDHTGGLYPFLDINHKAKVYVKKDIFTPKYRGNSHFIGTLKNAEILGERLVYLDHISEIDENVFVLPEIKIKYPVDNHFEDLNKMADNKIIPDEFDDELFMVIKERNSINIITGCSHRGITNICSTAIDFFHLPVHLILGGFHMKNCTTEQYVHVTHFLRFLQPETVGVCHCTGIENYAKMSQECEASVFYNYTGKEFNI